MEPNYTPQCPQCRQPLTLVGQFAVCPQHEPQHLAAADTVPALVATPFDALAAELPFPLALAVSEYAREPHHYVKLHRLADGAEMLTRWCALVCLSDVLRLKGKFPDALRQALSEKIERPTFGAWRELLEAACKELPKKGCFVPELPAYVKTKLLPRLGYGSSDAAQHIIALRNLLAHQGRLPEAQAQELLAQHEAGWAELWHGLGFLSGYTLLASVGAGRVVALRGVPAAGAAFPAFTPAPELAGERVGLWHEARGLLDLFPLQAFGEVWQWRAEGRQRLGEAAPQIYFRLNRQGAGFLEFTPLSEGAALAQQRGAALERFRAVFRLEEWRKLAAVSTERDLLLNQELAADLSTELFGREQHLAHVKAQLKGQGGRGVLWLAGRPGVGKSALLARLAQDYRSDARRVVIPYFFRTAHAGCSTESFLRAALAHLGLALGQALPLSPNPEERRGQFVEAVRAAAQDGRQVWFLLDGLDEIHRLDANFVSLVWLTMREAQWLCAGRPEAELSAAMESRGAQTLFPDGLPLLDESGVRAMLTTHLERGKYPLFQRDEMDGAAWRNRFVEVLLRKSEGLPLYLRLALDDLQSGRWTLRDEDRLPEGLTDYFERILERLRVNSVGTVLTPLLCLLAWAREPVTPAALKVLLSQHRLRRSKNWDGLFELVLQQGHLMLRTAVTPEGEPGLTFYHDTFRQHLLSAESVAPDIEVAELDWLEWCGQWRSLTEKSLLRYALRHYAEHLGQAQRWPELYDLARDEEFRQRQTTELPASPTLPLLTVQAALAGAATNDDAPAMAEMVLRHARRVEEIKQETPMAALRAGSLKRAWELADLHEIEDCTLWHLLMAWELKDTDRLTEGQATLARLGEKRLVPLSPDLQWDIAVELLSQVYHLSPEDCLALATKVIILLNELSQRLVAQGHFKAALTTAQAISDGWDRAQALIVIAKVQAAAGDVAAARTTFTTALAAAQPISKWWRWENGELSAVASAQVAARGVAAARTMLATALATAQTISDEGYRADALTKIAKAQAAAGDVKVALTTAQAISHEKRAYALIAIASAQATAGDVAAAQATAQTIHDGWCRAHALSAIAVAQAQAGDVAAALATERTIYDDDESACALSAIAVAQAQAGDVAAALATAQAISNEAISAKALREIAQAQAAAGESAAARTTLTIALAAAQTISDERSRRSALIAIASTQATAGDVAAAQATAQTIHYEGDRAEALIVIAKVQAAAGDVAAARTTFTTALAAAQPISNEWCRAEALSAIAVAQAQAGDVAAALATERTIAALATERTIYDDDESARALSAIAAVQAQAGDVAAALTTAQAISDEAISAKALSAIAKVQAAAGATTAARMTFMAALTTAQAISNEGDRAQALSAIASAQAAAGDVAAARTILTTVLATAQAISNEWRRAQALIAIAAAQAAVGDVAAAQATAQTIHYEGDRAHALIAIAKVQVAAGEIVAARATALAAAQTISQHYSRDRALIAIAKVQVAAGDVEAALATARTIDGNYRACALSAIAVAQAQAGETTAAHLTFTMALDSADSVQETHAKEDCDETLGEIAQAQAANGFGFDALETAVDILTRRNWHLPHIAQSLAEAGDKEHFKHLLTPCAYSLDSAYPICMSIVRCYPESAAAIAKWVMET